MSRPLPPPLDGLFAAVGFLTVLPVGAGAGEAALARSTWFYPLVGLGIGGVAAAAARLGTALLPEPLLALALVFLLAAASGFFHLDGLADTADGLFSARPREKILEIMRDSRVGVMGVVVLFFVLAAKTMALAVSPRPAVGVLLAPVAGRVALLFLMALLPYARSAGCAAVFYRHGRWGPLGAGLVLLGLLAWLTAGPRGLAAAAATLAVILVFAWRCRVRLGGATGDTLGAACELAETAMLLALTVPAWR